jgi:transposase-like protein
MEEKRLTFKCWQCDRTYTLLRDLRGKPKFITECPFCGQEAVVDLAPFRSSVKEIYQTPDGGEPSGAEAYHLPDIIPTSQPEP